MKAMITAFVACAIIAAAAPYLLEAAGFSTEAKRAGDAVRLGDAAQ
ncbi:hypothetical protein [Roseovarius sp.]|mgnify:CR=1 FL=1|nr:hypothetical protein [Roseovarius sp.]